MGGVVGCSAVGLDQVILEGNNTEHSCGFLAMSLDFSWFFSGRTSAVARGCALLLEKRDDGQTRLQLGRTLRDYGQMRRDAPGQRVRGSGQTLYATVQLYHCAGRSSLASVAPWHTLPGRMDGSIDEALYDDACSAQR